MAESELGFLERANQAPVTAELLGEVLMMVAKLPPEDRAVMEVRAIRMFKLLRKKGSAKKTSP